LILFLRNVGKMWRYLTVLCVRNIRKALVTRTQGAKIASYGLRVLCLNEPSWSEEWWSEGAVRKFKLTTEYVQGKNCLTNFSGTALTHNKVCSIVQKMVGQSWNLHWCQNHLGYLLQLFCVVFTLKLQKLARHSGSQP
jgi:small subunit ribosomal protein S3Ae